MSRLQRFIKILTLTCDESARIVSDSYEGELPWAQRAALRVHLVNCRWCRRVRKQLASVRLANKRFREHGRSEACCPGHRLSREAKERMIERLS
ncbi:zf-HC2 domain-containing protein [Phycisphaeraceae bacterium D3-23]